MVMVACAFPNPGTTQIERTHAVTPTHEGVTLFSRFIHLVLVNASTSINLHSTILQHTPHIHSPFLHTNNTNSKQSDLT